MKRNENGQKRNANDENEADGTKAANLLLEVGRSTVGGSWLLKLDPMAKEVVSRIDKSPLSCRGGSLKPQRSLVRTFERNSYDCYKGNRLSARNGYNDKSYNRFKGLSYGSKNTYNAHNVSYKYGEYNSRRSYETLRTTSRPLSYNNLKLPLLGGVQYKGRNIDKALGTILEDLPISLFLNPSLIWHEVSFVKLELFLESYLSHEFMWSVICGKKMNGSFKVLKVQLCDLVKTTFENGIFELTLKILVEKFLVHPIFVIDFLFKDDILHDLLAQNMSSCVKLLNQPSGVLLVKELRKCFEVSLKWKREWIWYFRLPIEELFWKFCIANEVQNDVKFSFAISLIFKRTLLSKDVYDLKSLLVKTS
ncbi:hypothetical protein M9H77_04255 [Catharanthus roseus]|uniref:Uncharacterized protein n=1 Tax=Catharanthus roseus TaxID=4058 RepID=A0ACC0CDS9_CATRO|nr:hypothetical protein M9H77_04255 [Catharanthus roseus]